jgi:hypothetical protein
MIEIIREADRPRADWVEAELRELVVGYQRILTTPQAARLDLGLDQPLPLLRDGERLVGGEAELHAYLEELAGFVHDWNTYQGDACYVDDRGESC